MLSVSLGSGVACAQGTTKYVSADSFLSDLESMRKNLNRLDLDKYDPKLLRQYFVHFQPRNDNEDDLKWKIRGLAAYGEMQDIPELERFLPSLQKQFPDERNVFLLRFTIPARHGDKEAMRRLAKAPAEMAVMLFPLCRTKDAFDRIAAIAGDDQLSVEVRWQAIKSLSQVGDNRSLDIALAPSYTSAVEREGGMILRMLAEVTGVDKVMKMDSLEEAREWIRKNNIRVKQPRQKISVKGGIDWSALKSQ